MSPAEILVFEHGMLDVGTPWTLELTDTSTARLWVVHGCVLGAQITTRPDAIADPVAEAALAADAGDFTLVDRLVRYLAWVASTATAWSGPGPGTALHAFDTAIAADAALRVCGDLPGLVHVAADASTATAHLLAGFGDDADGPTSRLRDTLLERVIPHTQVLNLHLPEGSLALSLLNRWRDALADFIDLDLDPSPLLVPMGGHPTVTGQPAPGVNLNTTDIQRGLWAAIAWTATVTPAATAPGQEGFELIVTGEDLTGPDGILTAWNDAVQATSAFYTEDPTAGTIGGASWQTARHACVRLDLLARRYATPLHNGGEPRTATEAFDAFKPTASKGGPMPRPPVLPTPWLTLTPEPNAPDGSDAGFDGRWATRRFVIRVGYDTATNRLTARVPVPVSIGSWTAALTTAAPQEPVPGGEPVNDETACRGVLSLDSFEGQCRALRRTAEEVRANDPAAAAALFIAAAQLLRHGAARLDVRAAGDDDRLLREAEELSELAAGDLAESHLLDMLGGLPIPLPDEHRKPTRDLDFTRLLLARLLNQVGTEAAATAASRRIPSDDDRHALQHRLATCRAIATKLL